MGVPCQLSTDPKYVTLNDPVLNSVSVPVDIGLFLCGAFKNNRTKINTDRFIILSQTYSSGTLVANNIRFMQTVGSCINTVLLFHAHWHSLSSFAV